MYWSLTQKVDIRIRDLVRVCFCVCVILGMLVLVWTDLNYGLAFEVRINGLIYGNVVTGKSIFGGKRAVFPVNCPRNQIGHKKVLQGERY